MRAPAPSLRPMTGAPTLTGQVHELVDLLGEHLAQGAAEDGEVLGEHEHLAAVDRAPAGDDAVGVGPLVEPGRWARAGQQVELVERAVVEQVRRSARGRAACPGRAGAGAPRRSRVERLLLALARARRAARSSGGRPWRHASGGSPTPEMADGGSGADVASTETVATQPPRPYPAGVRLPVMPPVRRCWPRRWTSCPVPRACCTSRSGTASAASCSATATRSSWAAATTARSPATSPSCSRPCGPRCPSGAWSTASSWW